MEKTETTLNKNKKVEERKKQIQNTKNFKKQYLGFYDDIKVSPSEDW